MKNKLLNIIKLMSLSAVMVSGGFASRIGQAVKANQSRIFSAVGAGALYGGSGIVESQPQGGEGIWTPKQTALVCAAALARNSVCGYANTFSFMQRLVGAGLINSGAGYNEGMFVKEVASMRLGLRSFIHQEENSTEDISSIESGTGNKSIKLDQLYTNCTRFSLVAQGAMLFMFRSNPNLMLIPAIGSYLNLFIIQNYNLEKSNG